jgi:hypothetical protein
MWNFRHRTRGRNLDMEEPERRHLAGRKTFITVEIVGVLHGGSNGSMVLGYSSRLRAATFFWRFGSRSRERIFERRSICKRSLFICNHVTLRCGCKERCNDEDSKQFIYVSLDSFWDRFL